MRHKTPKQILSFQRFFSKVANVRVAWLNHSHTMTPFDAPFENTVEKGEIARNDQFLLFPQCFLLVLDNFLPFWSNSKLSSANSFSLEESKICCLVMG